MWSHTAIERIIMVKVLSSEGNEFEAYMAEPAGGKGPGLVLLQEIFGVNRDMRAIADRYAALGFVVLCPDLFWRQEPGIELSDQSDEEWQRAFALYRGLDEKKAVEDATAALAFLRSYPGCTGRVGTVGFCLGGKLAYLMATRSDADCSVGYYGVGIESALNEAANIRSPLMLHIAGKDKFCPPSAQEEIHQALDKNSLVTIHDYRDEDHAFARA